MSTANKVGFEVCEKETGVKCCSFFARNKRAFSNRCGFAVYAILGLQPRDKAAMLVVNTKENFWQNLHQNRVHFPAEGNAFVFDHQHGRRDVTCKPAIDENVSFSKRSTFDSVFKTTQFQSRSRSAPCKRKA